MMKKAEQEVSSRKNLLYRDQYRRTIKGILFMAIIGAVLAVILLGLVMKQEHPDYYATTTTGQVIPMHPLSEPIITKTYLLQWAGLATRAAFNMDWVHYQANMQRAKSDFTPNGWAKFMAVMKSSGLLSTVIDKKLSMSAVVYGSPVIISTAVIYGRFTWRVQLPVLVTFSSASVSGQNHHWVVTMNVQRTSTLDAHKGIQISDFKAVPQL